MAAQKACGRDILWLDCTQIWIQIGWRPLYYQKNLIILKSQIKKKIEGTYFGILMNFWEESIIH